MRAYLATPYRAHPAGLAEAMRSTLSVMAAAAAHWRLLPVCGLSDLRRTTGPVIWSPLLWGRDAAAHMAELGQDRSEDQMLAAAITIMADRRNHFTALIRRLPHHESAGIAAEVEAATRLGLPVIDWHLNAGPGPA